LAYSPKKLLANDNKESSFSICVTEDNINIHEKDHHLILSPNAMSDSERVNNVSFCIC
jgi:hypothetical protein